MRATLREYRPRDERKRDNRMLVDGDKMSVLDVPASRSYKIEESPRNLAFPLS